MASYTLRYGRTYEEWVEEKARRIQDVLRFFYVKGLPLDLTFLASVVYKERLMGVGLWRWKPLNDRFLDFKPSPFIKNFINYLIFELVERGYLIHGWLVELRDRVRVSDYERPIETSTVRIYQRGLFQKVVEIRESLSVSDVKAEREPTPLKVSIWEAEAGFKMITVEARDTIHVNDEARPIEALVFPKPPIVTYGRRVIKVPSIDELIDLCTWKDPSE